MVEVFDLSDVETHHFACDMFVRGRLFICEISWSAVAFMINGKLEAQ